MVPFIASQAATDEPGTGRGGISGGPGCRKAGYDADSGRWYLKQQVPWTFHLPPYDFTHGTHQRPENYNPTPALPPM